MPLASRNGKSSRFRKVEKVTTPLGCASRKPVSLDFVDGFAAIGHPLTHGSPAPLPRLVVHVQPSDSPVGGEFLVCYENQRLASLAE